MKADARLLPDQGQHRAGSLLSWQQTKAIPTRGGEKNRFCDFSRFSLERFCLDSEKFIIDFLIKKKKKFFFFFFFFTHSFCVEMQAASIIALFIESHNCDKENLFL